ncbi:MAG: carboxymuconolactone decarboxylase family protein [Gammaproteobacteria bacterium]
MTRVKLIEPENFDDPVIDAICGWVTEMEGKVPNHFKLELNFPEFFKAKLGATKVLWEMGELSIIEIQHVGIAVSNANKCPYCTAAFSTILTFGLDEDEGYTQRLIKEGSSAIEDPRTKQLVDFSLKINSEAFKTTDKDVDQLRSVGLTDKGILQLVHLVSDFASYNRLNLALDTEYDYKNIWKELVVGTSGK